MDSADSYSPTACTTLAVHDIWQYCLANYGHQNSLQQKQCWVNEGFQMSVREQLQSEPTKCNTISSSITFTNSVYPTVQRLARDWLKTEPFRHPGANVTEADGDIHLLSTELNKPAKSCGALLPPHYIKLLSQTCQFYANMRCCSFAY